jgi:CIC family chloride channel protein
VDDLIRKYADMWGLSGSNTIAYLISLEYQRVPLFDILTRQDGVELPSMEEEREQTTLCVEDAMRPGDDIVLDGEDSVNTALQRGQGKPDHFMLVRYANGTWTGIQTDTLQVLAGGEEGSLPLGEVYTNPCMPVLHPDQPLSLALSKLGDWALLPVVSRANFRKLEGVVSLDDVLRTYKNSELES